jgi:hypothetical protein
MNFKNVTDAELAQAKVRVDASLAPIDHENLRHELRRRNKKKAEARLPYILKFIGGFLVLGAVVGAFAIRVFFFPPAQFLFPIMLVPIVLWAVAGAFLLSGKPIGVPLGTAALSLQLFSFAAGGVIYAFNPLIGAQIAWYGGDITLSLSAGPVGVLRAAEVETKRFAVDVLAMTGLYFLVKSLWSRARAA